MILRDTDLGQQFLLTTLEEHARAHSFKERGVPKKNRPRPTFGVFSLRPLKSLCSAFKEHALVIYFLKMPKKQVKLQLPVLLANMKSFSQILDTGQGVRYLSKERKKEKKREGGREASWLQ